VSNRGKGAKAALRPSDRSGLALEVSYWDPARVKPDPRNPRKHSAEQLHQIRASIDKFGFVNPLLVDEQDAIIAGHGRHQASLIKPALLQIPVIVVKGLSAKEKRALMIADNQIGANSTWDKALLSEELTALNADDFGLDVLGFDDATLLGLVDNSAADEVLDQVVAPPAKPVSRLGDVWKLGAHRIICGDCTDAGTVESLLAGAEPKLMVTDPPYGVELDHDWRVRAGLHNRHHTQSHSATTICGGRVDWSEAFALVPSLAVAYVWHASANMCEVLPGLLNIGFVHFQQIIWSRGSGSLQRQHYWFAHDPCWYVRKKNAPWYGKPGDNHTVWEAPSPKAVNRGSTEEKFDHPTQKPIELMKRSIVNHTKRGELVYEPFLGSGTTLAAAEVTGRACLGIELDPRFVDVVIKRWQGIAGGVPELVGVADKTEAKLLGVSFDKLTGLRKAKPQPKSKKEK
jgi:DNA modification methylase